MAQGSMKIIWIKAISALVALLAAAYGIITYQDNEHSASSCVYILKDNQRNLRKLQNSFELEAFQNLEILIKWNLDTAISVSERIILTPKTKNKLNNVLDELLLQYFMTLGLGLRNQIGDEAAGEWNASIRNLSSNELRLLFENPEELISNQTVETTEASSASH